ncbi:hypothetical protein BDA96_07G042000 [Sorghum bicolor]|uniref:Uncharacterized protein n=2 Tax=Sorghum bicolor TaxID=4558 RepID=A0A1B6PFF4_SORBI|nr:hypothetical protein BDA96_07G042000 [Sorghum bicolor]KXG24421.1 hypothetical protein SORBI_3007G039800 [Sorghum bicolor]OQU79877.1 hypothetical protein SORBI_3007G039884 [Sorghum bicolor]
MAKCQKHVSIQALWLLSMVLLASSVVYARTINGQTKEDINTRSVTMMTRSASSIIGSGEHPLRGTCVETHNGWWLCGKMQFRKYQDCAAYCSKHFVGNSD